MNKKPISLIDSISFLGKIVLVTGAASGIGRAIAERFAESGAKLFLLDVDEDGLKKTISCLDSKCDATTYLIDLSSKKEIDNFWKKLSNKELPDILVNNAGIFHFGEVVKTNIDKAQKIITLHRLVFTRNK